MYFLLCDKLWQYSPEHCGEDVGKDGDNDEKHEGEDDEGRETASDVLPTSKYSFISLTPNSQLQNLPCRTELFHLDFVLCSSTWWDRSEICLLSSSQSDDMPQPNSEPISGKEIYVVFLQVSENIHSQERIDVIFAIRRYAWTQIFTHLEEVERELFQKRKSLLRSVSRQCHFRVTHSVTEI